MSPSRRRAIGAVRGVASRKIRTRIYRTRPRGTAHYPGGAMVARGGSPPRPTAITPAKFARALRTRYSHSHGPCGVMVGRRDSRLAPRDTRGDEARETKVGWAVFLRGQNNSDRMES